MSWQRLDIPGRDEASLHRLPDGWVLRGVSQFSNGRVASAFTWEVEADGEWRARRGKVLGTAGGRAVDLRIERSGAGTWTVNGVEVPGLAGLLDLDLGFTPATNLFPLRRLGLEVGESADAPAAWLDDDRWTLLRLAQRYERRDQSHYWYESPSTGYQGLLTVGDDGFVREYPGLWRAAEELDFYS